MIIFNVLHVLNGRIRIEVPTMRGSRESARQLESRLSKHAGIESAAANPATGTVLVHYDPEQIDPVAILKGLGVPQGAARDAIKCRGAVRASNGVRSRLAETLIAELLEAAVVGLVGALA